MTRWLSLSPQTEAEFQADVVKFAEDRGWRVHHCPDGEHMVRIPDTGAGFPDLHLSRPPVVMLRKLKRDGAPLPAYQAEYHEHLRACGLDVAVWRPADWQRIANELL